MVILVFRVAGLHVGFVELNLTSVKTQRVLCPPPLRLCQHHSYILFFCSLSAHSTGSEVQICVDVAKALGTSGLRARVVSMPCWELFEGQDEAYQLEGQQAARFPGLGYIS